MASQLVAVEVLPELKAVVLRNHSKKRSKWRSFDTVEVDRTGLPVCLMTPQTPFTIHLHSTRTSGAMQSTAEIRTRTTFFDQVNFEFGFHEASRNEGALQ